MTKAVFEELVSRFTPFKRYKARTPDRCCLLKCTRRIERGDFAFKPTKNTGGYTKEARICDPCGQVLAMVQV